MVLVMVMTRPPASVVVIVDRVSPVRMEEESVEVESPVMVLVMVTTRPPASVLVMVERVSPVRTESVVVAVVAEADPVMVLVTVMT